MSKKGIDDYLEEFAIAAIVAAIGGLIGWFITSEEKPEDQEKRLN